MTRFRLAASVAALMLLTSTVAMAHGTLFDDFRKATPAELAMKEIPSAPGAPAVILDWVQRVDDSDLDSSEYYRIKILTEEGRKYADIEIPYLPLYYDLHRVQARMTKPDGTVVDFNGKVYDKVIIRAGGTRVSAQAFSIPGVEPGCIIEYRYDLGVRGQYLHDSRFQVQHELPVLHTLIWLKPYLSSVFSTFFTYRGLPPGKKPVKIKDHYELELENIPAFEKEEYAPPEGELKPGVDFFYVDGPAVQDDAFWRGQGKDWTKKVESFIGKQTSIIELQVKAAIGTAATPEDKVRGLYARAQQIRNLGFEKTKTDAETKNLHDNNYSEDVLRNGYGHPAEINRTFVAMARAAGFEANAVRISESEEHLFIKTLPIAEQLDGEVAVVVVDGKQVWLDPGTPGAPYGVLSWQKLHVPGILLSRTAAAQWVVTPEEPPAEALNQRQAILRIEDGVIRGKVTWTMTGQPALRQRVKNYSNDDAATLKSLEETARKWFGEGALVKATGVTGMASTVDPIVVELDVELPNLGSFAGSRALVPLSVFEASAKNPFAPTRRKHPIVFPYAWSEADDVTLVIPSDYAVESLPKPIRYDTPAATYDGRYEAPSPNIIHLTRRFEFRSLYFDQENYGALRTFFSKVIAADQDQMVLHKRAKTVELKGEE